MYASGADSINWSQRRRREREPIVTRRSIARRTVTWSALLLVAVFGFSKAVQGGTAPGYTTVAVGPGDTVWSIAAERYPSADTRTKVGEILQANGLSQPIVYPGEQLKVPNQ
jgi:hypothetical protein